MSYRITIAVFFCIPLQGYCLQFSIAVPSNTGSVSIIGTLEVKQINDNINFVFSPYIPASQMPNERMYFCPFYNHIDNNSLPTITVNLTFDPNSFLTNSYSAHYNWHGFTGQLLQTETVGVIGRLQQQRLIICHQEFPIKPGYTMTNLWTLINSVIESQARNMDKFAERQVNDIILLHNSDPRNDESFKVASVYLESMKEIVINFHPNERSNTYSINITIDISRGGTGLNKVISIEIHRNGALKMTVVANRKCTTPFNVSNKKDETQCTVLNGQPPMPPGGGSGSVALSFQEHKGNALVEAMEQ